MIAIIAPTSGATTENRRPHSFERRQVRNSFSDVVQQGCRHLVSRPRAQSFETPSHLNRVATIDVAELPPQNEFAVEKKRFGPHLVGHRRRRSRERTDETLAEMEHDDHSPRPTRARGCAARYCSKIRSWDTFVYTCVVEMDA